MDRQHTIGTLFSAFVLVALAGCSGQFWRQQADKDSYRAIEQKQVDGRWLLPRTSIQPDVRSRFFDPYSPDETPLPPDDPAAEVYMQCADGIPGYKSWHKLGRSISMENPQWMEQLQLTAPADIQQANMETETLPEVSLVDAIELSYIHSRDYQTELENLYLSALDLTFERFQFQVRYLGIGNNEPSADLVGTSIPGVQDTIALNSQFGVSQLLPTGGQWAVNLANNTLWLFSGQNRTTSASVLSYSLVQPLLLGAGRKIAMENLTQAERSLLYEVRDLARFRKELFAQTVSGLGGTGFLDLLTQLQGIRNQEGNIRRLEGQVVQLRALSEKPASKLVEDLEAPLAGFVVPESLQNKLIYDAERLELSWLGRMTEEQADELLALSDDIAFQRAANSLVQILLGDTVTLNVAQLESSLRSARNSLRGQLVAYENSLDAFKIQLGLPPNLEFQIDDRLLKQFQFIDPVLFDLEERIDDYIVSVGQLDPDNPDLEQMRPIVDGLRELRNAVEDNALPTLERDVERVEENLNNRLEAIENEADRADYAGSVRRDRDLLRNLQSEIQQIGVVLDTIATDISFDDLPLEQQKQAANAIRFLWQNLLKLTQSLQVVQIDLRVGLISINRFDLELEQAVGLAMENRLDLMNAKAEVTDARRRQEVAANQLKAVVDVVIEGDVATPAGRNSPVDFRGSSSSFRAGLALEAPLDQIVERNVYRQSQIDYQRARRDYMLLEDQIKFQVRAGWRSLEALERNLETARQALRFAALQYDQAVEEASRPLKANEKPQEGVQGQNLLNALDDVLDAQDALIGIWADYERERINIYLNMGIMEIDQYGVWTDVFYQQQLLGTPSPSTPAYLEKTETIDIATPIEQLSGSSEVGPIEVRTSDHESDQPAEQLAGIHATSHHETQGNAQPGPADRASDHGDRRLSDRQPAWDYGRFVGQKGRSVESGD